MNLRDLKYLVALVEQRHFGKAADACFVSQPALSMQIKKLEETLGVQLIERSKKSFLLTDIGEQIAEQAKYILQQVDTLHEMATHATDPYSGVMRFGLTPTLAPYLLPHITGDLAKAFPDLSLHLIEEKTGSLISKLQEGKLDAAILALPLHETELTAIPLFEEEFLLAVASTNKLAKRKVIKRKEMEHDMLLLLEDGHCMRDHALVFCQQINIDEQQSFRATSLETLRHMVASDLGVTLMPKLACHPNARVNYIPLEAPAPKRVLGLVSRASSARKTLLVDFAARIKKALAKQKVVKVI